MFIKQSALWVIFPTMYLYFRCWVALAKIHYHFWHTYLSYTIPLWARATQAQIEQYQSRLDFYLANIVIPYTSLLCKDFSCTVSSHTSDLDMSYLNIIDACVLATKDAIPYRNLSMLQGKHKHLPGWTPEHNLARQQSLFWHFIWVACERPREGEVADGMSHTRNHYHNLIRGIKMNGDLAVRHSLSNALMRDPSRDYCTEVKNLHKNKFSIQNRVDDKTGSVDDCTRWKGTSTPNCFRHCTSILHKVQLKCQHK